MAAGSLSPERLCTRSATAALLLSWPTISRICSFCTRCSLRASSAAMRLVSSRLRKAAMAINRQNTNNTMISAMVSPSTRPRRYEDRCWMIFPSISYSLSRILIPSGGHEIPRARDQPATCGLYLPQQLLHGEHDILRVPQIDFRALGLRLRVIVERIDCLGQAGNHRHQLALDGFLGGLTRRQPRKQCIDRMDDICRIPGEIFALQDQLPGDFEHFERPLVQAGKRRPGRPGRFLERQARARGQLIHLAGELPMRSPDAFADLVKRVGDGLLGHPPEITEFKDRAFEFAPDPPRSFREFQA